MVDNVAVTPGAGAVIATDDVGGVQHQIVKLASGADGVAVMVSDAAPLPVKQPNLEKAEDAAHASGDLGIMALAVRQDTQAAIAGTTGDYSPLQVDANGRLRTTLNEAVTATTGTITANAQTVAVALTGMGGILFEVTGTFTSVAIAFEASVDGGTIWHTVQAVRSDANTIESASGTISTTNRLWELSANGFTNFRVRCTAYSSGTMNVRIVPTVAAIEPIPAAQTQAVTMSAGLPAGTNTIGGVRLVHDTGQGAATFHHRISQATNVVNVKASAGNINSLVVSNLHATNPLYFKLYNSASAPTLGAGTPVQVYRIPATQTLCVPMGPFGIRCATGIAYALTSDLADTGVTNVAANDALVAMSYT